MKAIYPGSFDPLSNGHLDVITRASKIFSELHLVVSVNINKHNIFTTEERIKMLSDATKHLPNVIIESYDGLIVHYAEEKNIPVLIRSLRNYQDYEAEFSLYQFNKEISPNVETLLILPSKKHIYVSSSAIKELIAYNADISPYVPSCNIELIVSKFKSIK